MLNIAVIGAGANAEAVHMKSLAQMPDVCIKAVCDIDMDKAQAFAKRWDIPSVYESYMTLLKEQPLDAAIILVWPDQIYRITVDCLAKGLHCFIEKPAGITLFQATQIELAAKKHKRLVQVGLNRRSIPLVQRVVEIMKETTPIHQIEGTFLKNADASFYNGCADAFEVDTIHAADIISWLADSPPEKAAMVTAKYNSDITNAWNALIRFENGITGILKANYQTGGRVHLFEIHGPKASAYINLGFGDDSCDATILFSGDKGSFSYSSQGLGDTSRMLLDGREVAGSDELHICYGFYSEMRNFVDGINQKASLICPIGDAVKTMYLLDYLRKAAI